MLGGRRPMSTKRRDDLEPEDMSTSWERSSSTGAYEKVTRFRDGSSVREGGGPAGPMRYNKFGEEC